ncbi:MAG: cell wall hydrolase [Pseudolabrys sp.]
MIAHQAFQRDIFERDPLEPSVEEKIFLLAKRTCIGFASVALVLGLLDLANVHSAAGALAFWQSSRVKVLALGDAVRGGVQSISIVPAQAEEVAVRIPTLALVRVAAKIEKTGRPAKAEGTGKVNSTIAELAAARGRDAVQLAMVAPQIMTPPAGERRENANFIAPTREAAVPAPSEPRSQDLTQAMMSPAALAKRETPISAAAAPKRDLYEDLALPKPEPIRLIVDAPEAQTVVTPAVIAPAIAETIAQPELPIPLTLVPLPREAPGAPPPSPAERLNLKGKDYTKAERCLANAVYFESRSEPVRGQIAVAQVVMNRVFSGFYPNDICSVVYQNASRHLACQFTFACDGKKKLINERGAWARANRIARQTLEGQIYLPEVAKSTHYHANYVHPNWVHEMKRLARFGIHSFYRPYAWGNGAEEPVWGSGVMAQASAKKTAAK